MTKAEIIDRILNPGIVAIIRADSSEQLIDASAALLDYLQDLLDASRILDLDRDDSDAADQAVD